MSEENNNTVNSKIKDAMKSVKEAADVAKSVVIDAKDLAIENAINVVDENGNGKIDFEDIIIKAIKTPGVKVNREQYLRNNLKKYCDDEQINKAIKTNPYQAGISQKIIKMVADGTIAKQKTETTLSSVALGYVPGGLAVNISTTVADMAQYYAQLLVVM